MNYFNLLAEIKQAVIYAKNNGYTISDEIPFVYKNKCSPIGAFMIYKKMKFMEEKTIWSANYNTDLLYKNFGIDENFIDSFLLGFYDCPGEKKDKIKNEIGFVSGKEFRKLL